MLWDHAHWTFSPRDAGDNEYSRWQWHGHLLDRIYWSLEEVGFVWFDDSAPRRPTGRPLPLSWLQRKTRLPPVRQRMGVSCPSRVLTILG
jgi:hypothetical protein